MKMMTQFHLSIWLVLLPAIGTCGSWEIVQSINLDDNLTLLQENTSHSSQAGNYINLNDNISNASQSVTLASKSVSLTQNGGTHNKQSLNYLAAPNATTSNQSISNVSDFVLLQSYGSSNLQAGNLIEDATGNHTQSVTTGTATFSQTYGNILPGASTRNIQAGNAAIDVTGTLTQTFTAGSLTTNFITLLDNLHGENNYQAANYVRTDGSITTSTYTLPP